MKAKLLFSGIAVIGLGAISMYGFISTASSAETEVSAEQTEPVSESVESTEEPETDFEWTDEEYLLAKIAMAEAEGEDTEGKALVICVVLNRVYSDSFPDTIEEVIYQDGQFSPVSNGRFDRAEPDEDCYKALQMVQDGWDESQGALYFESESNSKWHEQNLTFLFQHGGHYFYTEGETGLCYGE